MRSRSCGKDGLANPRARVVLVTFAGASFQCGKHSKIVLALARALCYDRWGVIVLRTDKASVPNPCSRPPSLSISCPLRVTQRLPVWIGRRRAPKCRNKVRIAQLGCSVWPLPVVCQMTVTSSRPERLQCHRPSLTLGHSRAGSTMRCGFQAIPALQTVSFASRSLRTERVARC